MTSSSSGRHRARVADDDQAGGRHREVTHPHRAPVRRRPGGPRIIALLAVAGLAVAVVPVASDLRERQRDVRDGAPTLVGDGAGGSPTSTEPPSPASRPAEASQGAGSQQASPTGSGRARDGRPRPRVVAQSGPGTFRVAREIAATEISPGSDVSGDLDYTVEIEDGLPFAPRTTAATVDRVLADARGWETATGLDLRRTGEEPDFRVLLASPDTTDALCAPLATRGEVSCRNGDLVVLNAKRWATGVPDYDGHLRQYRTYLINHEVGHRLGFGHVECPAPGSPAPVMQQQTYGLDGCTRNAWPGT